jgi:tRNA (cmo5U34)-methyltransferase
MNEPVQPQPPITKRSQNGIAQLSAIVFDQERAAMYDRQYEKLVPLRDALHLLMRFVLSDLPDSARILCIGAGTGSELLALARSFPQWQFVAIDPAAPMLDICRHKVEAAGITSRCTFHEGYLDSLPSSELFDAATCIQVSHFLLQPEERSAFFRQIAERLRPNGILVSADLAPDPSTSTYQHLLKPWRQMLEYSEVPAAAIEKSVAAHGRDVALLLPSQVESIIAASGFDEPVLFFQTFLIHAWYCKKVN